MQRYRAVIRIEYLAETEVDAELVAMSAQNAIEASVIEVDNGDEVAITHIGPETSGTTPEELIAVLIPARNSLILTKSKPCWDAAKEIDKIIDALERHDHSFVSSYDHGRFFDIATKLLEEEESDADIG